jgi:hypothetical protein
VVGFFFGGLHDQLLLRLFSQSLLMFAGDRQFLCINVFSVRRLLHFGMSACGIHSEVAPGFDRRRPRSLRHLKERNDRLWLEIMDAAALTDAQVAEMRAIHEETTRNAQPLCGFRVRRIAARRAAR